MPAFYVDNAMNRRLGRVGMPRGSMPVSRDGVFLPVKTYVDNSYNRRLGRDGLLHGEMVVSRDDGHFAPNNVSHLSGWLNDRKGIKQEELRSQQVRLDLLEKKVENATRDSDDRIDHMQRKMDDQAAQMKKKEKQYEETLDSPQVDIDALEQEKYELKERLKGLSKKTLLEGISRQASATSPLSPAAGMASTLQEFPVLQQQITTLKEALKFTKNENVRMQADHMKQKSSQQVRLDLLENKVENATRDSDDRIDHMQRKMDDQAAQMKKKEKQYEEKLDSLLVVIHALEQEKYELKERLKVLSKKTLLEGISRQASATSPLSPAGSMASTLQESPVLQQQIKTLKEALEFTKNENIRMQADHMKETQGKVERTMMEQKNKLAYENGSLQTQVTHLTAEVDKLKNAQKDATRFKHINDRLQNKYDKALKELRDSQIKIQRIESQLRQTLGSYETKEKDYNELQRQRDEAVKERDSLITRLQGMEEKDQSKFEDNEKWTKWRTKDDEDQHDRKYPYSCNNLGFGMSPLSGERSQIKKMF